MDADAIRKNVDDLSRELLIGEPYFGHLLVGTLRLAVAGDFAARLAPSAHLARIEIGAARWQTLSLAARKAALKHELLHLTLKHPLRARSFALLELYGLACDLVVNQYMDTTHLEGAFTLAMFPGLLPNQTADQYYAALLPLYERCACDGGACSGEAGDGDGQGDASSPESALRGFLRDSEACRSHGSWRAFATLPSPALSVLEANVDALVEATVKRARCRNWGRMPGSFQELLEHLIDKRSEVPWRRVLRLFGASSERTYLKNTISRASKRYGTCPGIRVKRRTKLVVAVDTSGSVPAEDIAVFFSEIHAMWRRGASVTILEADATVTREYEYRGTPPKAATGRGGTAFDPAIARANALRPDALIYFTDGHAPEPTTRTRMPMLWVLTRDGHDVLEATHLPGRRVKLSRTAGA